MTTAACGSSACAVSSIYSGAAVTSAINFFMAAQCLLDEPWPKNASVRDKTRFDFIIVGGGTAGCTLAARLANTSYRVLLLEAGGDPPQDAIIPAFSHMMKGSDYDWKFFSENDHVTSQGLIDGRQYHIRGKMLGGSGSLNDMVYTRGFPQDYNEWATIIGNDEWNWTKVLEDFKKTEHLTDERIINDPELMTLHGRNGEIEVAGSKSITYPTDVFLQAFKEMNFNIVKDMTSPSQIGAGRHSHTIHGGRRHSSLTALLNKAAKDENLFVVKNAMVTKVLIVNSTAYGVEVVIKNETKKFYATREVILTAGSFNTPKLLMLSGIGPKDHLKEMGIPLVKDAPVGQNLQDHVMYLDFVVADKGTCPSNESEANMATIQYLYNQSGPLSYIDSMTAYFALAGSVTPNLPDFGFYPSCLQAKTMFHQHCVSMLRIKEASCRKLQDLLEHQELIVVAVVLLKPKSRGSVMLKSTSWSDAPLICAETFSNAGDLARYPEALEVVRRLTNTTHFRRLNAQRVKLDEDLCGKMTGDERGRCEVRARAMAAWHAAGTVAAGSVLDNELRVRGVDGLMVADASVMPSLMRGNTNAPVVMIAEKAAKFLLKDIFHTK